MLLLSVGKWFRGLSYALLGSITFFYMIPYLWIVLSTFRDPSDPFGRGMFPSRLVLTNYLNLFDQNVMIAYFRNSLFVSTLAAALTILLAIPAAYGFSRFRFSGRRIMMTLLLMLRTFPPILLAIGLFTLFVRAGLYNTHFPLILANTMFNLPLAVWMLRTVFDKSPVELEDAAMVDGCNRLQAVVRVILPISLPSLAAAYSFVWLFSWNEYLFATTFITSDSKRLVPTAIGASMGQFTVNYAQLLTMAVLASVPAIVVFILIQRYLIGGLSLGGVKG